jgi:2-dehydropantoate 2-reductase
MHIAILGSGGVGGYFGGRLAASGAHVTFIARGAHLEALQNHGLRIESPLGNVSIPVTATNDTAAVGPVDVAFFSVKLYDSDSAIQVLPPLLGPRTVVVPFQNGVESVEKLAAAIDARHVAGGTTYIVAHIAEPGVIRHTALGRLIFGPTTASQRPQLTDLLRACQQAGIDTTFSESIDVDTWAKFVALAALSGMTSVTRKPIGTLRSDPELWRMTTTAIAEVVAVARAKGVRLPEGIESETSKAINGFPPESKSSMLSDLENGRRLELPWLSGAVVRLGRELGVETPVHHFISTVLAPYASGAS